MSDPAKSAREIEDVLASIRRLVSESHVERDPDPQPAPAAPSGPTSARLVLTPALRVADPDDPWTPVTAPAPGPETGPETDPVTAPVSETAASGADADRQDDEDLSWGLEDRLSDWGEIEDSADEAVADAIAEQSDGSGPPPGPAWREEATLGEDPALSADFAATLGGAVEFEPETGDADWPDRSAGRALRDLALVRGQGGEAPVGDAARTDRDGGGRDAGDDVPAAAEDDADLPTGPDDTDILDILGASEAEGSMTEDESAQAAEAAPTAGFTPVFSRRIDVRRATGEPSGGAQPSGLTGDDPGALDAGPVEAGLADVGSAEADLGEDDAFDDDVEDLGEATQPFSFPATEEGLLDEETLRDIIAEVVREELQGALGQRITRNVRKMVRREIRLALAAEDLE